MKNDIECKVQDIKTQEELFKTWKQKPIKEIEYIINNKEISGVIDHSKIFVYDGIVNKSEYDKSKKVLFLLKEAYGGEKDWSLANELKENNIRSSIWKRTAEWSYGIHNTTESTIAAYSENIAGDKDNMKQYLNKIAVVNLKKSGGKSSSEYNEFIEYVKYDKEELRKQIEIIDPNIIICGYTMGALEVLFEEKKIRENRCENWFYYSELCGKERLIIDYYHPANRYPALMNYYGIVNIYQQALLAKKNL